MKGSALFPSVAIGLAALASLCISTAYFPLTARRVDLDAGAAIFYSRCVGCHSLSAGGESRGPALDRIGEVAGTRVPAQDAEQYLLDSILRPEAYRVAGYEHEAMPLNIADRLGPDSLINLVAFLKSLHGKVEINRLLALDTGRSEHPPAHAPITLGVRSIERGRELFLGKGNCSVCHELRPGPGTSLVAPSLVKSGYLTRDELMRSLREPSSKIASGYATWAVSRDGLTVSGRRLPAPKGRIRLLTVDAAGRPTVNDFAESELEPLDDAGHVTQRMDVSAMPPATQALSPEEIDCVIDFLLALK